MACNTTDGGSNYSAHKAVDKFAEHRIDMVSCVHRKCQTRACVSGDVNRDELVYLGTLERITITDSKFSNRVLE